MQLPQGSCPHSSLRALFLTCGLLAIFIQLSMGTHLSVLQCKCFPLFWTMDSHFSLMHWPATVPAQCLLKEIPDKNGDWYRANGCQQCKQRQVRSVVYVLKGCESVPEGVESKWQHLLHWQKWPWHFCVPTPKHLFRCRLGLLLLNSHMTKEWQLPKLPTPRRPR